MSLQMLMGPMFAFNGLDKYVLSLYSMRVDEETYFSYVIPAVLFFIAGLHINSQGLKGERVDEEAIIKFSEEHPTLPIMLIVMWICLQFYSNINV
jgi:hypothetical protein